MQPSLMFHNARPHQLHVQVRDGNPALLRAALTDIDGIRSEINELRA